MGQIFCCSGSNGWSASRTRRDLICLFRLAGILWIGRLAVKLGNGPCAGSEHQRGNQNDQDLCAPVSLPRSVG